MTTPDPLDTLVSILQLGRTKIFILTGAGLSTSSGLPDFRSPQSGLYSRLEPLQLPYPEAPFHISYFRHTPEPFYALAAAKKPRNLKPSISHAFLALLEKRGKLGFVLSQNVDSLEVEAGVTETKVLNVHGDWKGQGCFKCRARYPDDLFKRAVREGSVAFCTVEGCGGVVKPDIVMFGESLPKEFEEREREWVDDGRADLLLVMGSSLKVAPVSILPRKISPNVPRVLINNELVGDFGSRENDIVLLGDCDKTVREIARRMRWEGELESIWKEGIERKEKDLENEGEEWGEGPDLDECIAQAAEKMKVRMGVSEGHRRMLEGHLGEKMAGILGRRG